MSSKNYKSAFFQVLLSSKIKLNNWLLTYASVAVVNKLKIIIKDKHFQPLVVGNSSNKMGIKSGVLGMSEGVSRFKKSRIVVQQQLAVLPSNFGGGRILWHSAEH